MAPRKKAENVEANSEEKQKVTEESMSLEQAIEKLDEVMSRLESGDLSLEDSFKTYKQGMDLVKYCNDSIDRVEKQLMILEEEGI